MAQPAALRSLIASGTRLWLDSIDPDLIGPAIDSGVSGATSNPIIIADLIKSGRFDGAIGELVQQGLDDEGIAWQLTDHLVSHAEQAFRPTFDQTAGNDGYVSFELDPLIEDTERNLLHAERVAQYVRWGQHWSGGHPNRMIKVPATPAGLEALEPLAADGVPLNVTLIFSSRQYQAARDAIWRGAQKRGRIEGFKSVYSIFVSRIDVYTQKAVSQLTPEAQGQVGILNAKRIWAENQLFWQDHDCPLDQEIVFASTGTKNPSDKPWKYVQALAGSDIQTNPPATNQAVADSDVTFDRQVDQLPDSSVVNEIDREVDFDLMEEVLMREGLEKFSTPQQELLRLIASKRSELVTSK